MYPSQKYAHAKAKRAGALALARARARARARVRARALARSGKPSCACKLFSVLPLPDPKGLVNNGYICEYNQLSGIALALKKRIYKS